MYATRTRLRIGEAMRYTGYSRRTITLAVEEGRLHMTRPSGRKGGHRYFEITELDRWLDSLKSTKR